MPNKTSATSDLFAVGRYQARVDYAVEGQTRSLLVNVDAAAGCDARAENADLALSLSWTREDDAMVLHGEILCHTPLRLTRVIPLVLAHPEPEDLTSYFHNGWQSWSGSSALDVGRVEPRVKLGFLDQILSNPDLPPARGQGDFTSTLCTAAGDKHGRCVVVGYLDTALTFAGFSMCARFEREARITASVGLESTALATGQSFSLPRLYVAWGADAAEQLERYAARVGEEMHARVPPEAEVGWCSWYHYFTKIDEQIIRMNLREAVRLKPTIPFSLFQIDDGWQSALGDWLLPSKTFPCGMGAMASEIKQAGFRPGLWLAPFVAYPNSRLYAEHPEWFVRDEMGAPRYAMYNNHWGLFDSARALDLTHPDVQAWLRKLFHTIAHVWGYQFIKIDFLHAAGLPGKRHDPNVSGAQALRRGLEIIRETVGEDVRVLGCGLPLGPAIGLVDSNRVGMDVAPYWSNWLSTYVGNDYDMMSAKVALRNALTRSFMHRRLWQNDPDCILLRDAKTRLTQHEIHSVVTVAALCGGTLLISDDLSLLGPAQRALAQRTLELHARACEMRTRVLDLMERDFPTLFLCEGQGRAYLAVFNPDDQPVQGRVDLLRHGALRRYRRKERVSEYWSGASYPVRSGSVELGTIPRHGVRLLVLEEE
ncbi:MAG: alpha-galactosidase [Myxococcales bacterium]